MSSNPKISYKEILGSIYATVNIRVSGCIWGITKVYGTLNYVTIRRKAGRTPDLMGKSFPSFELAIRHYNGIAMKIAIQLANEKFITAEEEAVMNQIAELHRLKTNN